MKYLTYLPVKTDIQKYTDNKETAEISLCHYISVLCECVHAHRHSEFPAVLSVKRIWKSRPFRFGTEHNKVDRIGNKVNRNKMLNSRCCRLVAKTSNTVECIWYTATVDFQQSRPCWIRLCRRCVPGFNVPCFSPCHILTYVIYRH